ncbi:hypothetical protein AX16_001588 [Volvariella volvacea WC 439]|nr:hypothetical protein AX16_001588 [Volvariella volvacea WC 439]
MSEEKKPEVAESKKWDLAPETEYRFELDPGTSIAIKLLKGNAEIFGAELAEGKQYVFGMECKAAVFTWQGCTIEVTGHPSTEYVSEETPMIAYANLHMAFEQMRVRAQSHLRNSPIPEEKNEDRESPPGSSEPPRVLVLGPENSGKTTVSKILVNYAVRTGQSWSPVLVNTDPGEGAWAVPGALSAVPVSSPLQTFSAAAPLGSSATSAPYVLTSNSLLPIVQWYGHAETKRNSLLMERLIRNLGNYIEERWDNDTESSVGGLVVDTPSSFAATTTGTTTEQRQKLIKACVDAFKINVVLVIGHEKLNAEMQKNYGSMLTVVKIPKSGGVVELDHSYRHRVHHNQIQAYFYGHNIQPPAGVTDFVLGGETLTDFSLSPYSMIVPFDEISVYRIGSATMAPSSALPVGARRLVSDLQPVLVDPAQPGSGLYNSVLALLAPPNSDENERYDEEILDLAVVGFLILMNLDVPNKKMTILAPNQISLTGRTVIVGSYEWQE